MTNNFFTIKEAKDGYERIMKVVKRLLKSSHIHLRMGEYSTSIPLSILSLEEISKADYLRLAFLGVLTTTKQEWDKLTLGGKSHIVKLTYMLDKKQEALKRWTETDVRSLGAFSKKIGIAVYYPDKKSIQNDIDLLRIINPKLKKFS